MCMTIGSKKRNLDGKSNNSSDRYIVCITWNYIKEDIANFKNKRALESDLNAKI